MDPLRGAEEGQDATNSSSIALNSPQKHTSIASASSKPVPWYSVRRNQIFIGAAVAVAALCIIVPCAVLIPKNSDNGTAGEVVVPQKRLCTDEELVNSVVINEVYPGAKKSDWVELRNLQSECDVSLEGWTMIDDNSTHIPLKFTGPCSRLPASSYMVVFHGKDPKACQFSFGLSGTNGDSVILSQNGTVRSNVTWGAGGIPDGSSYARQDDGTYKATTTITKGKPNTNFTAPVPMDFGRTYPIADAPSAYTGNFTWDTVDTLEIQTWETEGATWDDMYNQERPAGNATKKISIGACIRTKDYPSDLAQPCGSIFIRGATSRLADIKSFGVKLDKNAPLGKWRGTRKLILSRSPWDYSLLRHAFGYELVRKIPHMVSLNANFVNVKINGTVWGLYTVVEEPDDDMLKAHGLDKNGFMLKAKDYHFSPPREGWPETQDWLDPQTHEDDAIWYAKIANLTQELDRTLRDESQDAADAAAFEKTVRVYFHEENVVTFLAVNALLLNHDIMNQNFFLYSPADARRWAMFLWDMDGAFDWCRQKDDEGKDMLAGCPSAVTGLLREMRVEPESKNALYRQLMQVDGMFERVTQRARELTAPDGPLSPQRCQQVLNKLANRIRPFVGVSTADPWPISVELWQAEVTRMGEFVSNLMARYEEREVGGWNAEGVNAKPIYPKWKCPVGVSATWCVA